MDDGEIEIVLVRKTPGYGRCGFCNIIVHATYVYKCPERKPGLCLGKWFHEGCLLAHKLKYHKIIL